MGPLTQDDLAALVAGGEDSFTEFKDPRVKNADVTKEMCAFANAAGGRILIGVNDDGQIVGACDWDEQTVMNLARTSVDPAIIPTFQRVEWEPRLDVVVVGVEQGAEKPYAVRSGEGRRYYIRVGSTSREATREELIRLTQASGAVASDLRPVLGATLDDLDPRLLAKRFEDVRSLDFERLSRDERARTLEAAEILREDGAPTIYGLLGYGRNPQERLPYAVVNCASYPGIDVGRELLDRLEGRGRLDVQIEQAVLFIERNVSAPSRVVGVRREEGPRPSRESFRELVANAICHRHYGIAGPTQLRVFADRVEITSPGGLPNGVTPRAMRLGVSVRRNEFLVQHLVSMGVVDALGRGVVLLYNEAAELGLREPRVEAAENWTRVTLFLHSESESPEPGSTDRRGVG